jgi:heat shock protein HtpX
VSDATDLFSQQEANRRKSRWLIGGFILFFAWLGFGGDLVLFLSQPGAEDDGYRHAFPWLAFVMATVGGGLAWFSWREGPHEVLWSAGATELKSPTDPAHIAYVNVVEEMSIAAGVPRPRIYLIRDADPNAFATGQDEHTASIAVTEGLLRVCNRDELQAVVAHELGHIKNLDVRLMTLLASLVGTVALLSDGIGRMMWHGRLPGGGSSRSRGGGKKDMGPLVIVLLVVWVLSWILAPIVTRLLALGVSRQREYLADAMAAQFTRNPLALASALEKVENAAAPTTSIKRGAAHLCIADPSGRRLTSQQGWLADRLATHPPMSMRIARLRAMGYQEMKREGTFEAVVG